MSYLLQMAKLCVSIKQKCFQSIHTGGL